MDLTKSTVIQLTESSAYQKKLINLISSS